MRASLGATTLTRIYRQLIWARTQYCVTQRVSGEKLVVEQNEKERTTNRKTDWVEAAHPLQEPGVGQPSLGGMTAISWCL